MSKGISLVGILKADSQVTGQYEKEAVKTVIKNGSRLQQSAQDKVPALYNGVLKRSIMLGNQRFWSDGRK